MTSEQLPLDRFEECVCRIRETMRDDEIRCRHTIHVYETDARGNPKVWLAEDTTGELWLCDCCAGETPVNSACEAHALVREWCEHRLGPPHSAHQLF